MDGTVPDNLQRAIGLLRAANVETPLLDAQLLIALALNCSRLDVIAHPEREMTADESSAFHEMLQRRAGREPLAHILGFREFHGLEIAVTSDVLVPRPETEMLVEEVVSRLRGRSCAIAEVGAGSGAISVALAVEMPAAAIYATEISGPAAKVARANSEKHHVSAKVTILVGDMLEPVAALGLAFDAVVSNPPYIPSGEIDCLEPEVRDYEPRQALDGGPDGLAAYRRLFPDSLGVLRGGGFVAVEVGMGQAQAVREIAANAGFGKLETARDLAGIERVVVAYR